MGKVFKILSIDGGGILGLYSADLLNYIEKELFEASENFSTKFDLITGTSTGGIIALGLALGHSAKEITSFYEQYGEHIFKKSWRKWGLFKYKYSNKKLTEALTKFFQNKTVSDCTTHICIPAIDVDNCQPIMFKTNNNGQQTRDENVSLVDVALATSAAPYYFPMHKFGSYGGLVDGGLWQNNPSLFGLIEACTYFVGKGKEYDSIKLLSVGNPSSAIREIISTKNNFSGLLKWNKKFVTIPMKISSLGTKQIMDFIKQNHAFQVKNYLRIETENLPSSKKYKKLALDYACNESYKILKSLSFNDFNKNKTNIINFFKED